MRTTIAAAETLVIRLQRRGRLLVALTRQKMPELTPDAVEETRTRLLKERARRR